VGAPHHEPLTRADLAPLGQSPIHLDALVAEEDGAFVFEKRVTMDDPGVREQRATPAWPHHLPGELVIGLTGQAGTIALHRAGLIGEGWRGHGVRIRDARFSKSVLVGETIFVRAEIVRTRRLGRSIHVSFRFRMWKREDGADVETYRSEQDAIFFPGE
jgi:acyl dehydratase